VVLVFEYIVRYPPRAPGDSRRGLVDAQPSQTLPRAGVWGNLVSPHPFPKDQG